MKKQELIKIIVSQSKEIAKLERKLRLEKESHLTFIKEIEHKIIRLLHKK